MRTEERLKFVRIAIISALMLVSVFVIGFSIRSGQSEAVVTTVLEQNRPELPFEAGVFRRFDRPLAYETAPERKNTKRGLKAYYSQRAYSGAPPAIPHKLLDPKTFGGNSCNQCHMDGGWVEEFQAYTPVTPHPELTSCLQCHVPGEDKSRRAFRANVFQGARPPEMRKAALPDAPPVIPHELEMRTNCVACHAGPAAVPELRTTHPERANCRQCHAMAAPAVAEFRRAGPGGSK